MRRSDEKHQQIYTSINKNQPTQIVPIWYINGIVIHLALKVAAILWHSSEWLLVPIFQEIVIYQVQIFFIVVDFWLTKNVSGRMLLGVRWYFGEDKYGVERLMFECRANKDYISPASTKIFWIAMLGYTFVPLTHLKELFDISPMLFIVDLTFTKVSALIAMTLSGATNIYYFWKVGSASDDRRQKLERKYGIVFVGKMRKSSIYSYL